LSAFCFKGLFELRRGTISNDAELLLFCSGVSLNQLDVTANNSELKDSVRQVENEFKGETTTN
jgi:hypothetical protein